LIIGGLQVRRDCVSFARTYSLRMRGHLNSIALGWQKEIMVLNWLAVICFLIPQVTQTAVAQVPDFSGTWKIDRNTSTYAGLKDLEDLRSRIRDQTYQKVFRRTE
jgi:hypothetical protein